jgi:hypothetical protein
MRGWIQDFPPQKQSQRFGNKSFRDWHAKLVKEAPAFVATLCGYGNSASSSSASSTSVESSSSASSSASSVSSPSFSHAGTSDNGAGEGKKSSSEEGAAEALEIDDKIVEELSMYLAESFGNAQRIDYGTVPPPAFVCCV